MDPIINVKKEYLAKRIDPINNTYEELLAFPTHFEIETINACNARCPMCTIDEWNKDEKMMSDELFKKIVEEIAQHKDTVKRVNLYRDGEPLLDKKLPHRIALCKELGIPNISISTNVSLMSEDLAASLLRSGIDMITLSIDSLNKDVYESIRRGLNFDEVLNNARNLLKIRNRLKSPCEIWIRMIRQESNIDEFESYKNYWESTGLLSSNDRVYYHNIFNWGGQLDEYSSISHNTEKHLPCVSLWSLMPIFANGDVPMCNVDFNANQKMGNVSSNSIAEIWNSDEMRDTRNLHLNGLKEMIHMCKDCNVWEEVPKRDGTPTVSSEYSVMLTPHVS